MNRPNACADAIALIGVVVENDAGTPIRYSYGDRRWYEALFRNTPAVVTRIPIDAPPEAEAIAHASGWVNEHVYGFEVDAARADRLLTGRPLASVLG